MSEDRAVTSPPVAQVALKGLCPRCGAPTLFDGVAKFAEKCPACGLDFTQFNVGDGPAAFLTLILGAIITALAITLELTVHPPFWVHMILWIPLTAGAVVLALRASKGALLALEYRNKAREVRNEDSR
jgi:uncharacterized protein (DUF983 family)